MSTTPVNCWSQSDLAGTLQFGIEGAPAPLGGHLDLLGLMALAFARDLAVEITRDLLIGAAPPNSLRSWSYRPRVAPLLVGLLGLGQRLGALQSAEINRWSGG